MSRRCCTSTCSTTRTANPITGNLMDYAMPSAAEFPSYEVYNTETPSPLNPLGAKGIGESATIGSTPAVHNAVVDALSHLGIRHVDMPCTAERVWRAIQDATSNRVMSPAIRDADVAAHRIAVSRRSSRTATTACPTKRAVCSSARSRRVTSRRGSISEARPCTNADASAVTYTVDSRDLLARMSRRRSARRRDRRRAGTATRTPTRIRRRPTCARPSGIRTGSTCS